MNHIMQSTQLEYLYKQHVSVNVFLKNGIKLMGKIASFDEVVVILQTETIPQMVYLHNVATILETVHKAHSS